MQYVVIDFETYFDQDYSLTRLSTEAYIRDRRFAVHGAAVKIEDQPAVWYAYEVLKQVLAGMDWPNVFLIAHHVQFDGFILAHHYLASPAMYGCTLSMARLLIGNHLSVSLDSVRAQFGLPVKTTPYMLFKGRHWSEINEHTRGLIAAGACDEAESVWQIFCRLREDFPEEEYKVIDETVRMFTEPVLRADTDLLGKLWLDEERSKQARLEALGVTEAELQSAAKFEQLLTSEGIEIEQKNGKNGDIPAFAKTDPFMRGLLEHPSERVRALAEARLGVKSTLLQTRAETLGWMASRGPLPVYYRYCGAFTTRWSGGDNANWQNFKRGSDIRKAILAPEGFLLGIIDLSQIECRLLNYLAGQQDVINKFALGEDPYTGIASAFYQRQITKEDVLERGTGKQAELSCGYGCGAKKFQATARLGIYGPPVHLSEDDAKRFVDLYRHTHKNVVLYWRNAEWVISMLDKKERVDWGPMDIRNKKIILPNDCPLDYTTLEYYKDPKTFESYWRMKKRNGWTKLYGSKLVENVVQALARVVLSQAMLRIREIGFPIVLTSHDELVVLLEDDAHAENDLERCRQEMIRVPSWLPGIPLDAEATLSARYAK
jgi:DNA polymerase